MVDATPRFRSETQLKDFVTLELALLVAPGDKRLAVAAMPHRPFLAPWVSPVPPIIKTRVAAFSRLALIGLRRAFALDDLEEERP